MRSIIRFVENEDGPTAVEYAVMLALIIGMCIAAIATAGGPIQAFWSDSAEQVQTISQ